MMDQLISLGCFLVFGICIAIVIFFIASTIIDDVKIKAAEKQKMQQKKDKRRNGRNKKMRPCILTIHLSGVVFDKEG